MSGPERCPTFPMPWACSMGARERLPVALARAAKPKKRAGSARALKETSRAAPMPSKAEPVSRADSTVRKRARPSR